MECFTVPHDRYSAQRHSIVDSFHRRVMPDLECFDDVNARLQAAEEPTRSMGFSARKLLLRGARRVGPRRGAGTGCEGVWGERGVEK